MLMKDTWDWLQMGSDKGTMNRMADVKMIVESYRCIQST